MVFKLTKRDIRLLQTLDSFALLSTPQINQIVFPKVDYRTVLRRLRKLEKAKLLQRTKEYKGGMSVWFLTGTGARRIGTLAQFKSINKNVLEHDLIVNDLRLKLEQLKMVSSWKSAHLLKHERGIKAHPLSGKLDSIPDWLCRINSWSGGRNVALELELSYKGPQRMDTIITSYMRKKKLHHLWYFVPTKTFGLKLCKVVEDCLRYREDHGRHWFLWSLIPDVMRDPFKTKIYGVDGEVKASDLFVVSAHSIAHRLGKQVRTQSQREVS